MICSWLESWVGKNLHDAMCANGRVNPSGIGMQIAQGLDRAAD
jgi:hypothetical protein